MSSDTRSILTLPRTGAMMLALATMATSSATAQQPGPQPVQLGRPIARESRTVDPAVLVATITVTPAADTVDPGRCRQFTATAFDAANRPVSVPSFRFSVSDPSRFQADEFGGGICATAGGPAAITQVTAGFPNSTITGSAVLTVRATPPAPRVPPSGGGPRVAAPPPSPELTAVLPPPYKKFWTSTNPSAPAVFASALNVTCGG
jgi:hypothetical protein